MLKDYLFLRLKNTRKLVRKSVAMPVEKLSKNKLIEMLLKMFKFKLISSDVLCRDFSVYFYNLCFCLNKQRLFWYVPKIQKKHPHDLVWCDLILLPIERCRSFFTWIFPIDDKSVFHHKAGDTTCDLCRRKLVISLRELIGEMILSLQIMFPHNWKKFTH